LLSYIIAKASVTIYAGAVVFNSFLGVDFWTGAVVLIVITGLYTVFGGLHAVMYTEALQAGVLLGGSIILTIVGVSEVGGWSSLV
jgi:SSS family solute:Na+ symporter